MNLLNGLKTETTKTVLSETTYSKDWLSLDETIRRKPVSNLEQVHFRDFIIECIRRNQWKVRMTAAA